ncbi:hypothetical protein D1872_52050 [compost metagenome]
MSNQQEVQGKNEFRDVIVKDVGEIPISDTQKYRVLVVLDENTKQLRVSAQRWWRKSKLTEWVAGKGFKLDSETAKQFANLILLGADEMQDLT